MSCDTLCVLPVPGPGGANGSNGSNGVDGVSAFTAAANYAPAAQPTMPYGVQRFTGSTANGSPIVGLADTSTIFAGVAVSGAGIPGGTIILSVDSPVQITLNGNATATASVILVFRQFVTVNTTSSTAFMIPGEIVAVLSWGYMAVNALPSSTSVQLWNPEDTVNSLYVVNAAPTTALVAGKAIVPSGIQGPAGADSSGAFLIANNLSEGAAATMRINLALGSVATFTQGNADTNVPRINDAAGLTNGEALFATAAGIESKAGAAAVTAIGAQPLDSFLTSIAALVTVADRMIYTTGVDVAALTTLTAYMRTVLAAIDAPTARGLLGISTSTALDYALYRYQLGSGVSGIVLPLGAWTIIPYNTEVVDEGNHGTLAAGAVTLAAGTYRYRFVAVASSAGIFQGRLTINGAVATDGYGISGGDSNVIDNLASLGEGVFTIGVASAIRVEMFAAAAGTMGTPSNTGGPEIYSSLAFNKE